MKPSIVPHASSTYLDASEDHFVSEVGAGPRNEVYFYLDTSSDLHTPSRTLAACNIVAVMEYKRHHTYMVDVSVSTFVLSLNSPKVSFRIM